MNNSGGQTPTIEPQRTAAFRTATVLVSIVAVCALAVDYGFRPLPRAAEFTVRILEVLIVGFFVAHAALRLYWARQRWQHLRSTWYEAVLVVVLAAALAAIAMSDSEEKAAYHVLTIQITIFLFLFIRLTELIRLVSVSRFRPAQMLVTSFVMLIALGTGLLMLPAAVSEEIHLVAPAPTSTLRGNVLHVTDQEIWIQSGNGNSKVERSQVLYWDRAAPASPSTALFTATSGVCVTGLVVESTGGYWSPFGQTVILVLIQLGGLGIMTFGAVFALLLWQDLGLRQSAVMKDMMGPTMTIQVGRVLVFILLSTAFLEVFGAWTLWNLWTDGGWQGDMPVRQRLFSSVFHSVSAFCNAGFCLYDDSLERYGATWQANVMFPFLIITGGLGFMVIYNASRIGRCHVRHAWTRLRGHVPKPELDRRRLTLQSKLVLLTSATLLVAGTWLFMLFETLPADDPTGPVEPDAVAMSQAAPGQRLLYGWFQSVTARTAGFNTSTTAALTDSSKFLTIVLMFIGASPGSTGGGIKTATLAVIMCGIWSLLRNRSGAQAFQRSIPQNILLRSLVVMTLGVAVVAAATMILSVTQNGITFLDALFESTSAFGTVGLSTGVTGSLNLAGRLLIIAVMFIGRVGPLTLFIALPLGLRAPQYEYPTETVAIG